MIRQGLLLPEQAKKRHRIKEDIEICRRRPALGCTQFLEPGRRIGYRCLPPEHELVSLSMNATRLGALYSGLHEP